MDSMKTVYISGTFFFQISRANSSSQRFSPLYTSLYVNYLLTLSTLYNSMIMKFSLAVGIWAIHMFQALSDPCSFSCFCPQNLSPCTTCTAIPVDEKYICKTECITKCFDLSKDPNNCGQCGNVVCKPPTHPSFLPLGSSLPNFTPSPPSPPKTPEKKKREGKLSTLSSAHPAPASTAAAPPHRAQATNAATQTGPVAITASAFVPPPALASAGQVRPALR